MADQYLNIPLPVLAPNQAFRIEYRISGSPGWTLWAEITTQDTTVTGLSAGEYYDFRITLLLSLSPLIECDPIIETHYIPDEQDCISITGELIVSGDIIQLHITPVFPSPFSGEPCGGYDLIYNGVLIHIPTFLTSPYNPLILPATNTTYTVLLYHLDCAGNRYLCDEISVPPVATPCIHATIASATITRVGGVYYLNIVVNQSSPQSTTFDIAYTQIGSPVTGVLDVGGVSGFAATGADPQTITFPINPNTNVYFTNGVQQLQYQGIVSDRCDYSSPWSAQYILSD